MNTHMVDCLAPQPGESICDPACGTCGFMFTAHNHITGKYKSLERPQLKHLKKKAFTGYELVQAPARVCAMNLMLHGIGSEKSVPVVVGDVLAAARGDCARHRGDLQAALEQFKLIAGDLGAEVPEEA
jgi:type I restriction enzyme M protein